MVSPFGKKWKRKAYEPGFNTHICILPENEHISRYSRGTLKKGAENELLLSKTSWETQYLHFIAEKSEIMLFCNTFQQKMDQMRPMDLFQLSKEITIKIDESSAHFSPVV